MLVSLGDLVGEIRGRLGREGGGGYGGAGGDNGAGGVDGVGEKVEGLAIEGRK